MYELTVGMSVSYPWEVGCVSCGLGRRREVCPPGRGGEIGSPGEFGQGMLLPTSQSAIDNGAGGSRFLSSRRLANFLMKKGLSDGGMKWDG